jgi:hypothetical protein
MNNLRRIIENTLVPHTAFSEGTLRLEQCFKYAQGGATEAICLATLGDARTGKSRLLEEFAANHPPSRDASGLTMPVLRVKTPSKPTVKSFIELMLSALKDPGASRGTENSKINRLLTLVKEAGTYMFLIDEWQHFQDKGSMKVMHHVSDCLKIIVDESRMALVVAGLPRCQEILAQNEQLAGRFLAPILMPRFDWKIDVHREEFTGIACAFQESIGAHFKIPRIDSPEMVFRLYCGCGGLIGYLTKFLRQVIWNAIDKNCSTVTLEDLARAHHQSVWSSNAIPGIAGPFTRQFEPTPSEDLLSRILLLGTPTVPVTPAAERKTRASKKPIARYGGAGSI